MLNFCAPLTEDILPQLATKITSSVQHIFERKIHGRRIWSLNMEYGQISIQGIRGIW